ncbi:MAG TPA: potassium-transporting ATPase subunit C [Candidatus Dormibacteraeota bacterium]|jgi:K+-transporting ATPase ATPase C chain|nr:potassium-transporting ATPase subunit C [Candidatus Dormibacteraeota bacterium]
MFRKFPRELLIAIRLTLVLAVVTGIVYPLVMTGVAQGLFHDKANGSLVTDRNGTVIGSALIGQCFYRTEKDKSGNLVYSTTKDDQGNVVFVADTRYFQSRPSFTVDAATGLPLPCNAANSVGSNLGPGNAALISRVKGYTDYLYSLGIAVNPDGSRQPMPVDLVTGDFTGFDPDITEAGALAQVDMVARARKIAPSRLRDLVAMHVDGRSAGVFGEPHVNVLSLNKAIDDGAAG